MKGDEQENTVENPVPADIPVRDSHMNHLAEVLNKSLGDMNLMDVMDSEAEDLHLVMALWDQPEKVGIFPPIFVSVTHLFPFLSSTGFEHTQLTDI